MAVRRGLITVAAGTNGAGKSSLIGEYLARTGGTYFNPDTYARALMEAGFGRDQANAAAWQIGFDALEHAIDHDEDLTFETTLGGQSISEALDRAIDRRLRVRIWYVGLDSADRHIARVRARVRKGGHDIPEAKIRERYVTSQLNLIHLLPRCDEVHLFDNSEETAHGVPAPKLILRMRRGRLTAPTIKELLRTAPAWAQPIAAAAIKSTQAPRARDRR